MGRGMRVLGWVLLAILALAASFLERAWSPEDQPLARIVVHTMVSTLDGRASRDQPLARIVTFNSWSDRFSSVVVCGGGHKLRPSIEGEGADAGALKAFYLG
ncbi:hypothetical protein NL676_028663 [Syzygium grande]|nr:hypothetical protein NL676_028663 [Syzygium grande]